MCAGNADGAGARSAIKVRHAVCQRGRTVHPGRRQRGCTNQLDRRGRGRGPAASTGFVAWQIKANENARGGSSRQPPPGTCSPRSSDTACHARERERKWCREIEDGRVRAASGEIMSALTLARLHCLPRSAPTASIIQLWVLVRALLLDHESTLKTCHCFDRNGTMVLAHTFNGFLTANTDPFSPAPYSLAKAALALERGDAHGSFRGACQAASTRNRTPNDRLMKCRCNIERQL